MVQVPELFTQYISSFSGCMGGNPNAPIWLVVDHSARCPLPIDPEKVFANPVTNIDALKRALPTTCPCTESVTRLINSITGNPEAETSLVFKTQRTGRQTADSSAECFSALHRNDYNERLDGKTRCYDA